MNRILRGLMVALVVGFVAPVRGATVTNVMVDSARVALQTNAVRFVPLDTPLQVSDGVIAVDVPVTCRTDTNGVLRVELVGGRYRVEFGSGARSFRILVPPEDTNVYSLTYCAGLATNVGTFTWTNGWGAISSRVLAGGGIAVGTNNAGLGSESVTVSGSGATTNIDLVFGDGTTNTLWFTNGVLGSVVPK